MTIDRTVVRTHLKSFAFKALFIEDLGWNHCDLHLPPATVNGVEFPLQAIAEKAGLAVFVVKQKALPDYRTRREIERSLAKSVHEHLIIFCDDAQRAQIWQWVKRETGRPVACREHHLGHGQHGEALLQKLEHIAFALEDEDRLRISAVAGSVRQAFDIDRVTKRFYERFQTEHKAFLALIAGLLGLNRDWYASLMLNRLMFIYFIQKKGFLDGDVNYLPNKLKEVQASSGRGRFHTFYRSFLLKLFHEGLGGKPPRSEQIEALIGHVPYLNGGLFDPHQLERDNPDIEIPDEAFEKIFAFFDAYQWHLDDRPLSNDTEINPDVLGYIFEKYINQKQMGAYYTKEDITEYISKSTVIPHLLQRASLRCKIAFDSETAVWKLLAKDPDRYLFAAVTTGVLDAEGKVVPETTLPTFVQAGMHDPKKRVREWRYNLGEAEFTTATGERGTLPTETWREYVARRTHCLAARDQLAQGKVRSIDDLITLNLDLRQFMQDVIDTCEGPELLRAIWHTIVGRTPERAGEGIRTGITILDPTCGSGAFLFAALGILEPLYEACLDRMTSFVEDAARLGRKNAYPDFEAMLDKMQHHPSRRYFIYKSIILHNLFGVDIMPEAVEICKLRLFLKLVSQANSDQELEPLPDIDFNIRAGNTLVGYATEAQFNAANTLASDQAHRAKIKASMATVADLFATFREQQTLLVGKVTPEGKRALQDGLDALGLELDRYLAQDYGVDLDKKKAFAAWRAAHQPFHWFAEFYKVMQDGGFDVIIGNPPYVEYKDVKETYSVRGFETEPCGDLYAFCIERALALVAPAGRIGLIVPISMFGTDGFRSLQALALNTLDPIWVSCYANRPSQLFDGAQKRLTILLGQRSSESAPTILTSSYFRWKREEFPALFHARIQYAPPHQNFRVFPASLEKLGSKLEAAIYGRIAAVRDRLAAGVVETAPHHIYYTRKFGYFLAFLDFVPEVIEVRSRRKVPPTELKSLGMRSNESNNACIAALSSSTFFWFWNVVSDCRNLNRRDLLAFPFDPEQMSPELKRQLAGLGKRYLLELRKTSRSMLKSGLRIETFDYAKCKQILDEIDGVLAHHYGFSDEELDFLVNFDIKYRMGDTQEDEE